MENKAKQNPFKRLLAIRGMGQVTINQIMNVDLALKAKDDISKYMEFSFSTVQQYKLLLCLLYTSRCV